MLIGEQGAVTELWDAARGACRAPARTGPASPSTFSTSRPSRGDRPARRDARRPRRARARVRARPLRGARRRSAASRPDGFRWRTRAQIEEGRSWLWLEDGAIRFKAEASAWTPEAVQLQQVWVDPPVRRRGYGPAALRDLIRLLLDEVPAVCLFVRAENAPAIRLYETVGMEHVARLPERAVLRRLLLVRHGHARSNLGDHVSSVPPGEGLSEQGLRGARAAGGACLRGA